MKAASADALAKRGSTARPSPSWTSTRPATSERSIQARAKAACLPESSTVRTRPVGGSARAMATAETPASVPTSTTSLAPTARSRTERKPAWGGEIQIVGMPSASAAALSSRRKSSSGGARRAT
jgi:hypothetical protein